MVHYDFLMSQPMTNTVAPHDPQVFVWNWRQQLAAIENKTAVPGLGHGSNNAPMNLAWMTIGYNRSRKTYDDEQKPRAQKFTFVCPRKQQ
jgi:hypothetical protein